MWADDHLLSGTQKKFVRVGSWDLTIQIWVQKTETQKTWFETTITLPETNIFAENGWLEYYFPIGIRPIFRCELLVSGMVLETNPFNNQNPKDPWP